MSSNRPWYRDLACLTAFSVCYLAPVTAAFGQSDDAALRRQAAELDRKLTQEREKWDAARDLGLSVTPESHASGLSSSKSDGKEATGAIIDGLKYAESIRKAMDAKTSDREADAEFRKAAEAADRLVERGALNTLKGVAGLTPQGRAAVAVSDGTRWVLDNTETGQRIDRRFTDAIDVGGWAGDPHANKNRRNDQILRITQAIKDGRVQLRPGYTMRDVADYIRIDDPNAAVALLETGPRVRAEQEAQRQAQILAQQQEEARRQAWIAQQEEARRQAWIHAQHQEAQRQAWIRAQQQEAQRQAWIRAQQQEAQRQAWIRAQQLAQQVANQLAQYRAQQTMTWRSAPTQTQPSRPGAMIHTFPNGNKVLIHSSGRGVVGQPNTTRRPANNASINGWNEGGSRRR
jgi:hypothetical protein